LKFAIELTGRAANEKGDGYDYFVNTTRDAIKDAPEYQRN
jgi:hypothetical protein